jgi:formylglycine-generating enzyme required for sulfatase activity
MSMKSGLAPRNTMRLAFACAAILAGCGGGGTADGPTRIDPSAGDAGPGGGGAGSGGHAGGGADGGTAEGADAGPGGDIDPGFEIVVGPEGGVFDTPEGATVEVPVGAVDDAVALTLTHRPGRVEGYTLFSELWTLGPPEVTLLAPLRLRLPYTGDATRAAMFWSWPAAEGYERASGLTVDGRFVAPVSRVGTGFVGDGVEYTDAPDRRCTRLRPLGSRRGDRFGVEPGTMAPGGGAGGEGGGGDPGAGGGPIITAPGAVSLGFRATDCEGRPLTELSGVEGDGSLAPAFRALQDGEPLSAEATPTLVARRSTTLFVTLLLDVSSSVTPEVRTELTRGADALVTELLERRQLPVVFDVLLFAGDRATVRLGGEVDVHLPSADPAEVRAGLAAAERYRPQDGASTNLNGALVNAIEQQAMLRRDYEARQRGGAFTTGYVVTFTDGRDTAGYVSHADAVSAVSGSSATHYGVLLQNGLDADAESARDLGELSPAGLLRAYEAPQLSAEFVQIGARIAADLEGTYLLGVCSPARAGDHVLSLELTDGSTTERAALPYSAEGFVGGCSAALWTSGCDAGENACGGLFCGACDERTDVCDDGRCRNACDVGRYDADGEAKCGGVSADNPAGYPQTCPDSPERFSCNGRCVDTLTDPENCGGCDVVCDPRSETCEAGACALREGFGRCGGGVINLETDRENCGGCDVVCDPRSETCEAGACALREGFGRCGGGVINLETDRENCGRCGVVCGARERCGAGACGVPPPTPGYVRIEPGVFTMGSPADELGRYDDETQHQVTLTRAFELKATEVTQAEWRAVMGNNPSGFQDCGDDCPVEQVSWDDAVDYCNALSAQQGLAPCYDGDRNFPGLDCGGYRLPTEAEWEYAARAGTQTAFYTGDITYPECRPLDPNLDAAGWYCGNDDGSKHPVGQKQPNAWGLYDMHGNVWEWVNDWYGDYPAGAAVDPLGSPVGDGRVERGGSWDRYARSARSANRYRGSPDYRRDSIGFRPARSL